MSILTLSAAAEAQIAIGGAVGASTHTAGEDDRPYLGPGFGGSNVASVIFFDVDVGRVSLGAELSAAGNVTGSQQQRAIGGINTLVSSHHDTVVSAAVKLMTVTTHRFHLAVAGGIGFARRHTERTGIFRPTNPMHAQVDVTATLSDTAPALSGGMDGVVAIGQRMGLLALFRLHYIADNDRTEDGVVRRGVSSVLIRYGVGARFRF